MKPTLDWGVVGTGGVAVAFVDALPPALARAGFATQRWRERSRELGADTVPVTEVSWPALSSADTFGNMRVKEAWRARLGSKSA